jgi:hypothetical protein
MKRVLALALTLASVGVTASAAESKVSVSGGEAVSNAVAAPAAVQWRRNGGAWRRNGGAWGRNRVRVTTQTRFVRRGRQVYRETYQIRYLPNGASQTRLISRVRVR